MEGAGSTTTDFGIEYGHKDANALKNDQIGKRGRNRPIVAAETRTRETPVENEKPLSGAVGFHFDVVGAEGFEPPTLCL